MKELEDQLISIQKQKVDLADKEQNLKESIEKVKTNIMQSIPLQGEQGLNAGMLPDGRVVIHKYNSNRQSSQLKFIRPIQLEDDGTVKKNG